MLKLSRKSMLAVEAVLDIAYYGRAEPVQAKEITARQGVPQRHLEQVMQQLVHEGVLKGVRGPRGGYRLARERRRISVGDIVRVVSALETPEEGEAVSQSPLGEQVVWPFWTETQEALLSRLDAVTIEDLYRTAREKGVSAGDEGATDFTI